jgi:hypothetical protein
MGMDDASGGEFSFKLVEGNAPMTSDYGIKLAEVRQHIFVHNDCLQVN